MAKADMNENTKCLPNNEKVMGPDNLQLKIFLDPHT